MAAAIDREKRRQRPPWSRSAEHAPGGRRTPWKTFLRAHWEGLAAADLVSAEVLTLTGLKRYFVFFVIQLKTRQVEIAGMHPQPDGAWIEQCARNLTDPVDGFLRGSRQMIHDRDPLTRATSARFWRVAVFRPIRLPPRSPNLNAYAERFVLSIKEECLNRVVPLGEGHLRLLVREYAAHYHHEWNHQGLGNQLLKPMQQFASADADVRRQERLGGLSASTIGMRREWPAHYWHTTGKKRSFPHIP